jgi:hypothetical protein
MKKVILLFVLLLLIFGCQKQEESEQSVIFSDSNYSATSLIDITEIMDGGPPMDGIPSIDDPIYVSVEEADKWIEDDELVLAMEYQNVVRVYPLQIMVWHEIVNDHINGDPILVTYCPLCGSGIAYYRLIQGKEVEFGTSGKLYNSNLIMYDRLTETYWTQIDGIAVYGELVGLELEEISIDTVVWGDWKINYPESEVLSQETGYTRSYGNDPYGSYYADDLLFFPVNNEDRSIHPKMVTYGIEVDGIYKAYLELDIILESNFIEDVVNGQEITIIREESGRVKIINKKSGEEIVKERDFWFAWYAFHPETLVYGR